MRTRLLPLTAALLLAASGCGSDSDEAASTGAGSEPAATATTDARSADLEVVEDGHTQIDDAVFVGAVIRNPSAETRLDATVQFDAIDERGDVIASESSTFAAIPAGQSVNMGMVLSLEARGKAKEVDVTPSVSESGEVGAAVSSGRIAAPTELPRITRERVEAGLQVDGYKVRAQVENTLDYPLSALSTVYAVLRDSEGKVIGGTLSPSALGGDLQPGRRRAVELTDFSDVDPADADVSVSPEPEP